MNSNYPIKSAILPVALDAMGGDLGSSVAVDGAVQAARELGIPVVIVGREDEIRARLNSIGAQSENQVSVCHAAEVVTMDDTPSSAVRRKPNSSIRVAFELLKEGKVSAVVSPGNTGAVMAAGMLEVGAFPGIVRPAIASLIPKVGDNTPTVLLDSGANIECHAHQLVQFALMGSYYAMSAIGIERPRVGLLSNGSESSKGTDITRSAAMILSELPNVNYIGYVEGRDVSRNLADVVVCDGFTGNVLLKAMEGAVELVFETLKHEVRSSSRGKLGMWLAKPSLKAIFKEKLDPSSYGGAPLLGLNGVGIVCHGAASQKSFFNGIRVAHKFVQDGLVAKIGAGLASVDSGLSSSVGDGVWSRMGLKFTNGVEKKDAIKAIDKSTAVGESQEK